jgi:flavin-dependent dehydrogenase
MAARELARRGVAVLLVDKSFFPRYKVCGCCLNPRSLRLLEAFGLGSLTQRLNAIPLKCLRLVARGTHALVPMPIGAAVSRQMFDAAIVSAAIEMDVAFLPGATATLSHSNNHDRRILRLRTGTSETAVECRMVLAANGLARELEEHTSADHNEPVASRNWVAGSRVGAGVVVENAPAGYEPGIIYMACGDNGYVGLVQIENGRLDVAAALNASKVKAAGGPGALAATIIASAGLPSVPDLPYLHWKGTPHLTRSAPRVAGDRLFVLGDAAGYIEPFTGEGIAWALSSAMLVAPLALRGIRNWQPNLAHSWQAIYRRKVTPRQTVCRITAAMLRRPRLTHGVVMALSVMPWLLRPLFHVMYRE